MNALTALASRISTRAYTDTPVASEALDTILAAGSSAPVALGNYGNVHFTVVQNPTLLRRLSGSEEGTPFYGAPCLILISAKQTPYPNIEFFNSGCIMENMFIAATALGLGSVFISGASPTALNDAQLLADLQLPAGYSPVSAVAVGHAQEALTEKTAFKNGVSINRLD